MTVLDTSTGLSVDIPLNGNSEFVRSVAYSPNGEHIVLGSDDGTIRVWKSPNTPISESALAEDCLSEAMITYHSKGLASMKIKKPFENDGCVCANDGKLLLWVPHFARKLMADNSELCFGDGKVVRGDETGIDCTNFCYGTDWVKVYKGLDGK